MNFIKENAQALLLILSAAIVLLLGIAYNIYDVFSALGYLGEMFQFSFWTGLSIIILFVLFIYAVVALVIGVLNIFGIAKSEMLAKIIQTVGVALFALIIIVSFIAGGSPMWAFWVSLVLQALIAAFAWFGDKLAK